MRSRAVVVGASMAGLLTARVLSDHVDEVDVFERDALPTDAIPRRGVPQGRHAHALLAAGKDLIETRFPGIVDEMVADGAVIGDGGDGIWWQAGALKVRADIGITAVCMSRPAIENAVRRRLESISNVCVHTAAKVDGLAVEDDAVVGIRAAGEQIHADLVVDTSGRNSRLLADLANHGFPAADESVVRAGIGYATRILTRRPGDLDAMYAIIAATPPFENRAGALLPIEDERWIVTLGGYHGDIATNDDDDGFLAFARSLPHPSIARVIERAEPLSPVMTHRFQASQRRHFDQLDRLPRGFVALGDVVCSFNPIYGEGMSSAALQAEALGRVMTRHGPGTPRMAKAFYKKAARVVDVPWKIAVGSDFLHPLTTGPKPLGTDMVNRYVGLVQRASHVSPAVLTRLQEVQNLLAPPRALMSPAMVARVLATQRRSPAVLRPVPETVAV